MAVKEWGWKTKVSFKEICDRLYEKALTGFE